MKKRILSALLAATLVVSQIAVYAVDSTEVIDFYDDFSGLSDEGKTPLPEGAPTSFSIAGDTPKLLFEEGDGGWYSSTVWQGNGSATAFKKTYSNKSTNRFCFREEKTKGVTINYVVDNFSFGDYSKVRFMNLFAYNQTGGLRYAINETEDTFIEFGFAGQSLMHTYGGRKFAPYITKCVNGERTMLTFGDVDWPAVVGGNDVNWYPNNWDIEVFGDTIVATVQLIKQNTTSNVLATWTGSVTDADISNIVKSAKYPIALFGIGNNEFQFTNAGFTTGNAYISSMGSPGYVMYNKIDAKLDNGVYKFTNPSVIRRIKSDKYMNQYVPFQVSQDNVNYKSITAELDSWGVWNNNDVTEYSYIKFADDIDAEQVEILTNTKGSDVVIIEQLGTGNLYVEMKNANPSDIVWTVDDTTLASVQNGVVTGLLDGSTVVRATAPNGVMLSANIQIKGELTLAIENNTLPQYFQKKKPVIDKLNSRIATDDTAGLSDFLLVTGDANLSDIAAINRENIIAFANNDPQGFANYLDKLATYEPFEMTSVEMLYEIEAELNNLIKLCDLDNLTDKAVLEELLIQYNDYLRLPLDNKYYLSAKDAVLDNLLNGVFNNPSHLRTLFKDAYVLNNLKTAQSYKYVMEVIRDCEAEIGYNTAKVDNLSEPSKLFVAIFENLSSFASVNDIKTFINNYQEPEKPATRPSTVGGGGGGGGSGVFVNKNDAVQNPEQKPAENVENPNPQVEQMQLFNDVTINHWAYEPIRYLVGKKAIDKEGANGFFNPDNMVTRAEFLKMLLIGMDFELPVIEEQTEEVVEEQAFSDVDKSHWAYDILEFAKELGLVNGNANGTFKPDAQISRQEMAVMIFNAVTLKEITPKYTQEPIDFTDRESISDWALGPVIKLQLAGVLNGDQNKAFRPSDNLTRAEAAKAICKAAYTENDVPIETEEVQNEEE